MILDECDNKDFIEDFIGRWPEYALSEPVLRGQGANWCAYEVESNSAVQSIYGCNRHSILKIAKRSGISPNIDTYDEFVKRCGNTSLTVSYYCEFLDEPDVILTEDVNEGWKTGRIDSFIYVTTNRASKPEKHMLASIYDRMDNQEIGSIANLDELLSEIDDIARLFVSRDISVDLDCIFVGAEYHDPDSVTLSFKLVDLETLAVDNEDYEGYSEDYLFFATRKVFYMALMDFLFMYCRPDVKGKRQYEKLFSYATKIGDALR